MLQADPLFDAHALLYYQANKENVFILVMMAGLFPIQ